MLLPKAIVIHMRVMMAMWGADTLVAAPAEARMNSCDASSQAGIPKSNATSQAGAAKGNTTKADTSSIPCGGYNRSGCHNGDSGCN